MNPRYLRAPLACLTTVSALLLLPPARAQQVAAPKNEKAEESVTLEKFVVTGSLIKRIEGEGALPLLTLNPIEMEERGIVSAEQMIMELNINGNGLDNLASNADVVSGAARGNNGATSANLRGQGAGATLVLLNGRRVASHGLNGGVVDLNSIPFAALDRVDVLKDGASATYGTDAVGGVLNFILKSNFQGLSTSAATDVTEQGGGNIHRFSVVGGVGNLSRDKFNLMSIFSVAEHKRLRGDQRDFVNTFQPDRGLSVDTRGTPIATLFPISTLYNALSRDNLDNTGRSTGPADPQNPAVRMSGGINIVDLPGGAGYKGLDGMAPYDELLWAVPTAKYASAWDTGRAAVLQQPVRNTNSVTRAAFKLGLHHLIAEAVLGRSTSTKSFSPSQWTSSATANTTALDGKTTVPNPLYNLAYPSTGADYNRVFNALVAYFPALEANRGQPLAFRWRSMPLGNRALATQSDTTRFMIGAEGPLSFLSGWEYRTGVSRAESQSSSVLAHGYVYSVPFVKLINTGVVNPFSYTQTPEAMKAIDETRADGIKLYGGTYRTDQADLAGTGPLFRLPAGTVNAAVGVDWRQERYFFTGDPRPNLASADAFIANAPFDTLSVTAGTLKRTVKAVFAEVQVPLLKGLDVNAAGRRDDYTGFGASTNPKITLRYAPTEKFLVRSSYSTGFRVPSFKQQFDPRTETAYVGNDFADPKSGTTVVSATNPAVHPLIYFGGKPDLEPETAKMYSAGFVFAPTRHFSGNVDWWSVNRDGTIQSFGQTTLAANYNLFQDRFIRDAAGNLTAIDTRWINAGKTVAKGMEFGLRGDTDLGRGKLAAGFDLSYLLDKKSKLIATAPFGASEVAQWTRANDVGIRWKHTAHLGYRLGNWSTVINQTYRTGYIDQVLPGVSNGTVKPVNWQSKVKPYDIFGLSVSYRGLKNTTVIAGIKNLFNTDPPFSVAYDSNSGAGSSWEPRVADPRGRSYWMRVEYRYR